MTETRIHAEAGSLSVRAGGPATGNVWLAIGKEEFPAREWNDFIVVVLGWWATALVRLLRSTSTEELVDFMDGPYTVEVSRPSSDLLRFRALEGSGRSRERTVGERPTSLFVSEVLLQSREVIETCKARDWWSRDADLLEAALRDLEQEHRALLPN